MAGAHPVGRGRTADGTLSVLLVLLLSVVFVVSPARAQTGGFLSSDEAARSPSFVSWSDYSSASSVGGGSAGSTWRLDSSDDGGWSLPGSPRTESSEFSSFDEHRSPSRPGLIRSSSSRFVVVDVSVPRSDSLIWRTHSYTDGFYEGTYGPSPTDDETTLWFTSSYNVLRTALSDITGDDDDGLSVDEIFDGFSPLGVVALAIFGSVILILCLFLVGTVLGHAFDGGECFPRTRRFFRRCRRNRTVSMDSF